MLCLPSTRSSPQQVASRHAPMCTYVCIAQSIAGTTQQVVVLDAALHSYSQSMGSRPSAAVHSADAIVCACCPRGPCPAASVGAAAVCRSQGPAVLLRSRFLCEHVDQSHHRRRAGLVRGCKHMCACLACSGSPAGRGFRGCCYVVPSSRRPTVHPLPRPSSQVFGGSGDDLHPQAGCSAAHRLLWLLLPHARAVRIRHRAWPAPAARL